MGTTAIQPLSSRPPPLPVFGDGEPSHLAYTSPKVYVRVRGNDSRWVYSDTIRMVQIGRGLDGGDDVMTLQWVPDGTRATDTIAGANAVEHFAEILNLFNIGAEVQAYTQIGRGGEGIFAGFAQPKTMNWGENHQSMTLEVLSKGQVEARRGVGQQILGRIMRSDPDATWNDKAPDVSEVTSLAPVFNAGGKPNRSASPVLVGVGPDAQAVYTFTEDNAPGAQFWTYNNALRYLCYWYTKWHDSPISVFRYMHDSGGDMIVAPHMPNAPDPFIRDSTRQCDDDVSVQSTNLDSALALLCDRAGLKYHLEVIPGRRVDSRWTARYEVRIIGYLGEPDANIDGPLREQPQPEERDIPRDVWVDYATPALPVREIALRTAAQTTRITIDDKRVTRPIFLGGHKLIEGTFPLRPLWAPLNAADVGATEEELAASHYLDNVTVSDEAGPNPTPLTEAEAAARIATAVAYWKGQFRPGNDPDATAGRTPRSIYHAEHPDHAPVSDVFRSWGFPDSTAVGDAGLARGDGVWSASRYATNDLEGNSWYLHHTYGPGFTPDTIEGWIPRWRPFLDTRGRAGLAVTTRAPIVRIHFGNGTGTLPDPSDEGWRVYQGNVTFDPDRAAIHLTEADPWSGPAMLMDPADHFGMNAMWRYIQGDFWLSITASVMADQRLRYDPAPDADPPGLRTMTVDLGFERFQYHDRRGGNSHLNAVPEDDGETRTIFDDTEYEGRDDTDAMAGFADRVAADMARPRVAGTVTIPWFTTLYKPGDVATGIAGLGIRFERYPIITRVTWLNADGKLQTQLSLTDLRENPEVAA